jgi:hypothetical protein
MALGLIVKFPHLPLLRANCYITVTDASSTSFCCASEEASRKRAGAFLSEVDKMELRRGWMAAKVLSATK